MPRKNAGLRAVIREIEQSADRSTLFWWMVEHHDELTTAGRGRRKQWAKLCARFAALKLTDTTGKPASVGTARETWKRVRRAVADDQAQAVARPERSPPPSKLPRGWKPSAAPSAGPAKPGGGAKAWNPEEQLARLRRTVDGRSGRHGEKK